MWRGLQGCVLCTHLSYSWTNNRLRLRKRKFPWDVPQHFRRHAMPTLSMGKSNRFVHTRHWRHYAGPTLRWRLVWMGLYCQRGWELISWTCKSGAKTVKLTVHAKRSNNRIKNIFYIFTAVCASLNAKVVSCKTQSQDWFRCKWWLWVFWKLFSDIYRYNTNWISL